MINVIVVEDQKHTREMLADLLNGNGYSCVGAFASAEEAIDSVPDLAAQVGLIDIHLPGSSGIECVRTLKRELPDMQFIMCSSLEDSDNIFNALKAGASGYLTKATPGDKILEAVLDAYNGGSPMNSQIARKVVTVFQQAPTQNKELAKLSSREQEILDYLAKGYRYKEIAGLIFISIETVRKHIHNIYEKLQVNSRMDAINKVFPKQ